jgi:hypothetical protein
LDCLVLESDRKTKKEFLPPLLIFWWFRPAGLSNFQSFGWGPAFFRICPEFTPLVGRLPKDLSFAPILTENGLNLPELWTDPATEADL